MSVGIARILAIFCLPKVQKSQKFVVTPREMLDIIECN